jgi:predicted ferric reductase
MFLLFFATFLVQVVVILYRNGVFHGRLPRAKLAVEDKHTVAIKISLSRQVNVAAGQYISIWIPSISLHSFLQSHPFVVSNWTEPKQDSVDLLVNSQRGFTQNLYNYAKGNKNDCLVLFSGPHGVGIPIDRSETVIMIASGFGMAALLPHIRQLIYSYNAWKCSTRRIRIIWEIEKAGKYILCPVQISMLTLSKRRGEHSRNI